MPPLPRSWLNATPPPPPTRGLCHRGLRRARASRVGGGVRRGRGRGRGGVAKHPSDAGCGPAARARSAPPRRRGRAAADAPRLDVGGGRAAVAAAVADGRVFVMGGNGGSGPLARVESYDPRARAWRAEPPLRRPRSGACAVGRGGALVVAGGGAAGQALPCVERLALRGAGAWIDLPGLCEARWGAALVAPTAGQVCS